MIKFTDRDRTYRYEHFSDEELKKIMISDWDRFAGNHALLLGITAGLISENNSVLDIGCGMCHLYELIKNKVTRYVGIDIEPRILQWAKERYPHLEIINKNVYNLDGLDMFDVVTAVGLYRFEPVKPDGVIEMLKHTKQKLILTYFATRDSPLYMKDIKNYNRLVFVKHNMYMKKDKFQIVEIYK